LLLAYIFEKLITVASTALKNHLLKSSNQLIRNSRAENLARTKTQGSRSASPTRMSFKGTPSSPRRASSRKRHKIRTNSKQVKATENSTTSPVASRWRRKSQLKSRQCP